MATAVGEHYDAAIIGDVKGGPAFTHISYDDYRILKTKGLRSSP